VVAETVKEVIGFKEKGIEKAYQWFLNNEDNYRK
jgi:hypothetical protein